MSSASNLTGQRGITMVESLVALVVLSIGMLGIASLYIASLKAGRSALVRTQAINLATDIADRIRANRAGMAAYATAGYAGAPTNKGCVGATCSPADLAEDDLFRWKESLTGSMPGNATGVVEFVQTPGDAPDRYTITIAWRESGDTADSTTVLVVEL